MKLKVWKFIGLLGTIFMLFVDIFFIKYVIQFVGIFYSNVGNYDIGTIILYTVVMGFVPFFIILFVGGLLAIGTLFFLTPLIDF
jgi:hypothetical protein